MAWKNLILLDKIWMVEPNAWLKKMKKTLFTNQFLKIMQSKIMNVVFCEKYVNILSKLIHSSGYSKQNDLEYFIVFIQKHQLIL